MNLTELIEIQPECGAPGAEPSLRMLVEKYYQPHFPENYKEYAKDYFDKLEKKMRMEEWVDD